MHTHYPYGTVRNLLNTSQVTDATRHVLTHRLTAVPAPPQFFSDAELALLQALCDRLIPQDDHPERIDIAGGIDKRLAQNKSDGWRYDVMPADGDAYKLGLQGLDETAQVLFNQPFGKLTGAQQDEIIGRLRQTVVPGAIWQQLPADRFFEEVLVEAASLYYSHPIAQESIGYVGMADVPTWQHIGLNQREDREPVLISGEFTVRSEK